MRTDDYKQSTYTPALPDEEFGIACDSSQLVYTWREYAGNRVYGNGVLSRLLFDGGYVSFGDSGEPTYHYYIKDYLGNNRIVADAHGNVEEVNHYYPYGTLMGDSRGTALQPYKYIGKELDRTHGLDWYDHGARHYDPITGRWNTMDKLCELAFDRSPYSSCHDNPVKYIDPDGMYDTEAEAAEAAKKKKARYYQDQKTKKWFVSLNADGDGAYTSGNTVTRDFGENGNAAIDAIGFAGTGASLYASRYYYKSSFSNSGYWANGNGIIHSFSELERKPNGKYTRGVQGLRNARKYAQVRSAKWRMAGNIFGYIGVGYEAFNLVKNFKFTNCLNLMDAIGSAFSLPYTIISIETKGNYEIYKENLEIKRYNMENNFPADYGTINPRTGIRDYSSGILLLIDK